MSRTRIYITGICLLFPFYAGAIDLPCDTANHPQVCTFLHRYISELQHWNEPSVSVFQKMHDDKFILLDCTLEDISRINDSTSFSLIRYETKAYEAIWKNGRDTVFHVAFPIQYELLLGMPQIEIEQHLQEYIASAPQRHTDTIQDIPVDSIAPCFYRSAPKQHYQIPSLNNCSYFRKDKKGLLQYVDDTANLDYTVANLFQHGLGKQYLMQVSQSVYGFKKLNYTTSLQQWLNYCAAENLTSYVAIEQQTDSTVQVLVVAENKDLGYNHIVSVLVPREVLGNDNGSILVNLNAFIPTHNISDLYERYTKKERKKREWTNE